MPRTDRGRLDLPSLADYFRRGFRPRDAWLLDALHVPPQAERVSTCGVLVQGVECVMFRADDGGLWVLRTLGSFRPGDRVRVDGDALRECASFCMQGEGCLDNTTIEPCPGRVRSRVRPR